MGRAELGGIVLVISPYARQGYVDHKTYSFESWLRIVEERFGVLPMTGRDNTANDMADAFDFTQQPRPAVVMNPAGSPYPPAPLFYVSPSQVNWLVPRGVATGAATVTLTSGGATFTGTALIGPAAPGLFTANLSGQGPAAAQVTNGLVYSNTSQCSSAASCTLAPIDPASRPYLILYGTGIRGASQANVAVRIGNIDAPVTYAGAQGTYAGLDQVNATLPATLKGRGQLVVTITANGQATNLGQLLFP